jgi:ATP-binding cassette subfamily G (WHITE) protein 2 (SNQ2)
LDILANRKRDGFWSGDIFIDRKPRSKFFSRDSAYVLQDDVHLPLLTVEETIYYAAWTRLPEGTSAEERQNRVNLLIQMMGLDMIRNSIIGDSFHKGISGGQLKRVSIAVEIVGLPNLIFLDEPTSGLDSSIALEVMSVVRQLSNQNRTCISTIHQPSPEVFALFDMVILLSGGRLIYAGGTDKVIKYFTSPALGFKYSLLNNAAEFICDISGGKLLAKGASVPKEPVELEMLFANSSFCEKVIPIPKQRDTEGSGLNYTRLHATNSFTQFQMLMTRSMVCTLRDVDDLQALLLKNIFVGALIGMVFYNQGHASEPLYSDGIPTAQVTSVSSLLFFGMMYVLIGNVQSIPNLCSLNTIYRREIASYAYSCAPFWLSQCIINIPFLILFMLVFCLVVFWLVGFTNTFSYFLYFFIVLNLANFCSFFFAMFLAAVLENAVIAFSVFPLIFLFLSTFAGYSIAIDDLPPMWHWASYVSYARWGFEGLMVNQWESFDSDDTTYAVNGNGNVLSSYGFDNFNKYDTFWILIIYWLFTCLCVYWGLRPSASRLQKIPNAAGSWFSFPPSKNNSARRTSKGSTRQNSRSSSFSSSGISLSLLNGSTTKKSSSKAATTGSSNSLLKESLLSWATDENALAAADEGDNVESQADEDEEAPKEELPALDEEYFRQNSEGVKPSRGCRLTFRNLNYTVNVRLPGSFTRVPKVLLSNVSGRAQPGEMCALMGSSGAGKSTLLDILANRKTTGTITGDIYFNGTTEQTNMVMHSMAYVMQDNVHIAVLTVRECLQYAAELRLPQSMPGVEKFSRVDRVLSMLGLKHVQNSFVGDSESRGISGGQLKRLSIGVEIIHLPDLIFLDEPTTGLDSAISLEVMSAVRNLANQNRTIMCTIHQPSQLVYKLFDKLLLLSAGLVIYFGPAKESVSYFLYSPFKFHYAPDSNPADYVVAVAGGFLKSNTGQVPSASDLADLYLKSEFSKLFLKHIDNAILMDKAAMTTSLTAKLLESNVSINTTYTTGTIHQMSILMKRVLLETFRRRLVVISSFIRYSLAELLNSIYRSLISLFIRPFRHIVTGLFYGSIYYQLATGTDSTCYTNRISLIFFSLMFVIIGHQMAIPELLQSRLVYYRERGSKLYDAFPYWISRWFLQAPLVFINVLTYSSIVYNMAGLRNSADSFVFFVVVMFLTSMCGFFVCQLVAAAAPSAATALSFFPVSLFFTVAFAGYIVYIPQFPSWLGDWGPYGSFMRFSLEGLVLNEFNDNSNLPLESSYIDSLGYNSLTKENCVPILVMFVTLHAFAVFLALRFMNFEDR